ncbi:hypothetical protein GF402_11390 [Candidatus Fermentibacteria bacterium]|nr:hypothetical protein [Candidatus Fermentibacteria bacterium]
MNHTEATRAMLGTVQLAISAPSAQPFPVEAQVSEEDTYLVLSSPREVPPLPNPDPHQAMRDLMDFEPYPPGTICFREGHPLQILAVVHDLNDSPSWREEWISTVIRKILEECELRELSAIGLPVLGAMHGSLTPYRFGVMLREALRNLQPRYLRYLWIVLPEDTLLEERDRLVQALSAKK